MTPAPDHPRGTGSWSGTRSSFPPKVRRQILQRAQGQCELSLPGCTGRATEADHKVGVADALAAGWDPADIDDPANGQALCSSCHKIKTRAEQARGLARARRRRTAARRAPERHPGLT